MKIKLTVVIRNDPQQSLHATKCRKQAWSQRKLCSPKFSQNIPTFVLLKRELDYNIFSVIYTAEAGFSNSMLNVQYSAINPFKIAFTNARRRWQQAPSRKTGMKVMDYRKLPKRI